MNLPEMETAFKATNSDNPDVEDGIISGWLCGWNTVAPFRQQGCKYASSKNLVCVVNLFESINFFGSLPLRVNS